MKRVRCVDIVKERDRDLLKIEKEVIRELGEYAPYVNRSYIIMQITKKPAPRYYITAEWALRLASILDKGEKISGSTDHRTAMIEEVYTKYKALCRDRPDINKRDAMELVINSPASSFFVSIGTIQKVLK